MQFVQGFFPRDKSSRGVKLTTLLQLLLRSRKNVSSHPLPRIFHDIVKHKDKLIFIPLPVTLLSTWQTVPVFATVM
jgi:hypothetical protein